MLQKPGLTVEWRLAGSRAYPPIGPIWLELARLHRIAELDAQDAVAHLRPQRWIVEREDDLDTPIQVTRHQVGTAQVDLLIAAVAEVVGAAVLQEAPDDADHPDTL